MAATVRTTARQLTGPAQGPPEGTDAPEGPSEPGMPTGAVARHLGVSATTVRSWERRYGIGPSERQPGHHRRWRPEDIALLEAMCRLTARGVPPAEAARAVLAEQRHARSVLPEQTAQAVREPTAAAPPAPRGPGGSGVLPVGTVRPECRGLARAAVRLDGPQVGRILRETVDGLGVVDAWTEVMVPALRATGRKWSSSGERFVEVEHLLSWHVSTVLRAAAVRPVAVRPMPPVLLAAMPDEQHALALEAMAAGLTDRGLPFRMLGAAVPPRALLDAVHRVGPSAVMLWSQLPRTADPGVLRQVAHTVWGPRGSRGGALVVAGGPGWDRSTRPPGTAGPRSLTSALDLIERAVSD